LPSFSKFGAIWTIFRWNGAGLPPGINKNEVISVYGMVVRKYGIVALKNENVG